MHSSALALILLGFGFAHAALAIQQPLIPIDGVNIGLRDSHSAEGSRKLQGRFLHITDLHPDPFYKYHSSTEKNAACHRGEGAAGILGAETTDCDAPISLINATFKWIDEHLKDDIDFVIWTGDSARHDNDEKIPRSEKQVVQLNELLVRKFVEVFGKGNRINDTDPTNDFIIPIVPTFGNNDILPHNILINGPNKWTKKYSSIWRKFIPEEQRHGFERGGWFYVEVIPKKLAVFSLNTIYFFDSNTAVDGCAAKSEPGYEHMEWLRIQLEFLRQRGMKAIMMGHVPPARTESKMSWDETCWQKYTLWMRQYRDVVVGSVYGHMNIDHFILQDIKEVNVDSLNGHVYKGNSLREAFDDELTAQSSAEYLSELRNEWSHLPDPEKFKNLLAAETDDEKQNGGVAARKKKNRRKKREKFFRKIGGRWGERYSSALVSPSVIPNYFPTIRVIEYNITGIDALNAATDTFDIAGSSERSTPQWEMFDTGNDEQPTNRLDLPPTDSIEPTKRKKKPKKPKKSPKPNFPVPKPPSRSSPPGPAYSPQTLTWLAYTQYFANLTSINNDFAPDPRDAPTHREGAPHQNLPKPHPPPFAYELEYDTRTDPVYAMPDLTVLSHIDLAARIGQYRPAKGSRIQDTDHHPGDTDATTTTTTTTTKKGKKHHRGRKAINRVWIAFAGRAFVGTRDEAEFAG